MPPHNDPTQELILWPDPQEGPWGIRFRFHPHEGKLVCIGVEVFFFDIGFVEGLQDVTATLLRSIPIASLARVARERNLDQLSRPASDRLRRYAEEALFELENRQPGKGGRPVQLDADHLSKVALTYASAAEGSGTPTKAVAEEFQINYSTAAHWVSRCRELGLLAPTSKGRPSRGTQENRQQT